MKTSKLNKNENPFDFDKSIKDIILDKLGNIEWNRYSSQYDTELISKVAAYSKVDENNVLIGPGAVYFLNLCVNIFGQANTILPSPSFPFYETLCKINNCPYKFWELNSEFDYDLSNYPDIKNKTLTIICSPNNPTGNVIDESIVLILLERYPNNVFVIDETYYEFCNISLSKHIDKYPNLIVVRSFSKVFASAGVRFGYMLTNKLLRSVILKQVLPYNINIFSQVLAHEILTNNTVKKNLLDNVDFIKLQREKTFQALCGYPSDFKIYKSGGNFLCLKFVNNNIYNAVLKQLKLNKISIANLSDLPYMENSFRMTIDNEYENKKIIRTIKNSLSYND